MKNDRAFKASRLDELTDSFLYDLLSQEPRSKIYSFIDDVLKKYLPAAEILPWQDDFYAWWNSPVIRIGTFCLRICESSTPGMQCGCDLRKVAPGSLMPLLVN